jgi:hypothetical protein
VIVNDLSRFDITNSYNSFITTFLINHKKIRFSTTFLCFNPKRHSRCTILNLIFVAFTITDKPCNKLPKFKGIVSRDWRRLQMVLLERYEVFYITAWGLFFFKVINIFKNLIM